MVSSPLNTWCVYKSHLIVSIRKCYVLWLPSNRKACKENENLARTDINTLRSGKVDNSRLLHGISIVMCIAGLFIGIFSWRLLKQPPWATALVPSNRKLWNMGIWGFFVLTFKSSSCLSSFKVLRRLCCKTSFFYKNSIETLDQRLQKPLKSTCKE